MYGYMNKAELTKLMLNKRDIIVIPDKQLKDLSEYLINVKIYLDNSGINTSIFNLPRVIKNKVKKSHTIFLVTRYNSKQDNKAEFMRALQMVQRLEHSAYVLSSKNYKGNGGYLYE